MNDSMRLSARRIKEGSASDVMFENDAKKLAEYVESTADPRSSIPPHVLYTVRNERDSMACELDSMRKEMASVLTQLDELADQWGDEAVFRRCRDRLRKLLEGEQ